MASLLEKKKLPTLLALLVLFVGAGAGVLLVGRGTDFLPRADSDHQPKEILVSNVTDRSFTVSWLTDAEVGGYLEYGVTSSLGAVASDDRDQLTGQTGNFLVHFVTVRDLQPETDYFFMIGSGSSGELYGFEGQAMKVKTGKLLISKTDSVTVYGEVLTQAQTPAEGSVVYVQVDGSAPLSSLIKASGSFAIDFSSIRTQDNSDFYPLSSQDLRIDIKVVGSNKTVTTGRAALADAQPLPTITLGQDFDLTETLTSNQEDPIIETKDKDIGVELINPSTEGELINTQLPEIQGVAPPGVELTIEINSPVKYTGQVTTEADGSFSWVPPKSLEPGGHTITIRFIDPQGLIREFQRSFVVMAQGNSELPSLTATPSATPRPTPSPTPKPTPTSTPKPTLKPSPSPSPSPSASARPSPSSSQVASSAAIPVAGSVTPSAWLLLVGTGLVTLGMIFSKKIIS